MLHLPKIVQDLALILGVAGVVSVLFRALKQPVVLGYILAGIFVGPHITLLPSVTDLPNIQAWAEIGVIFLLFSLGLEFSLKKLQRVGGAASLTAIVEVTGMMAVGFALGSAFGWSRMDSLFLGGILAISSTTIILRAFEEAGVRGRGFVELVFGVLVVEDLVAILLLVLLSTVAVSNQFAGAEMVRSLGKLGFFLTLWFVSGIFLVPSWLRRARRFLNDETLLVICGGLCFLMVVLATKAGFSPALGAFLMGSILAETPFVERIEHLIKPVKDLFAAVFFVSVGMLIDPGQLRTHWDVVAIITVATVVGKTVSTATGALLAGRSLRHSVQSGLSLAQIGEFSFIIAALGQSLNVTSAFLYPIAVGVSALTTFLTPYLIRSADRVHEMIETRLPEKWKLALLRYESGQRNPSAPDGTKLSRLYLGRIFLNAVLVVAVFLLSERFLPPNGLGLAAAVTLSSPFLWGLTVRRVGNAATASDRALVLTMELLRVIAASALFVVLSLHFVPLRTALWLTLVFAGFLLFTFSRQLGRVYGWLEDRFIRNLSEREHAPNAPLAPWDAHIARFELAAESPLVGQTLGELGIRESFGVTVALIERGGKRVTAPGRKVRLYPHDRVSVIGTDEQITRFRAQTESPPGSGEMPSAECSLEALRIREGSPFLHRTIRESGVRERTDGLVVGVERGGRRILNPDSAFTVEVGDLLWIVGDPKKIEALR